MLNKFKNIDAKSKVLMKNTVMLYLLQFSTYLFSFLTVPYQSRILGPEIYGILGVAGAVMIYFQLFMDFGFLLSATEDISKNRDDKQYICRKITSIAIIKMFLPLSALRSWRCFAPSFRNFPSIKCFISCISRRLRLIPSSRIIFTAGLSK